MLLRSLVRSQFSLLPIEVELKLVPGLPQFQILGLPDAAIRESVWRIKSALRTQGFEFPTAQQILVYLKPSHFRKQSRGLDLAIAAALLFETKQVPVPHDLSKLIFYGELSLTGEITAPEDLVDYLSGESPVVTGAGLSEDVSVIPFFRLEQLREPWPEPLPPQTTFLQRPILEPLWFSPKAARAMMMVAAGEHSVLVAGSPGTGKTLWAQHVGEVLTEPEASLYRQSRQIARYFRSRIEWRPIVAPHHSTTSLAMIGGGLPVRAGQITRAHGGVLVLDELLEFSRVVQEALREPMETGTIKVARTGEWQEFPADVLVVATTNLCLCGHYIPGRSNACRCSTARRTSYLQRLSGPLLDRFQVLLWSADWRSSAEPEVSLAQIAERVTQARTFARERRASIKPNSKLDLNESNLIDRFAADYLLPETRANRRRLHACLRVARTVADLEMSESIQPWHCEEAAQFSVFPFQMFNEECPL